MVKPSKTMMTLEEIAAYNRKMAQNFSSGPLPPLEERIRRAFLAVSGRQPTDEEIEKEVDCLNSLATATSS